MAATTLARAGWEVVVLERSAVAGGAVGSAELTVPGYVHDPYSAFYGLLHASPVYAELDLGSRVSWADFDVPVAAGLSPGVTAALHRVPDATAAALAARHGPDGEAWSELVSWWDRVGRHFLQMMLAPIPSVAPMVRLVRGARRELFETAHMMLTSMEALAGDRFHQPAARALLASGASHADVPVNHPGGVPAALVLAMVAQRHNMPVPVGGAGRLADALVDALREAGGEVRTAKRVTRVIVERGRAVGVETADGDRVPARRAVVADTGVRALFADLVDAPLPASYLSGLRRFRSGTGVFKVDLALRGPAPWRDEDLARAGVVHLCGDIGAMARAGFEAGQGIVPGEPMLIVGQQSLADPTRAPAGAHTLWVETHVPSRPEGGWAAWRDRFTDTVVGRLETFAPGLGSLVVGQAVRSPEDFEAENPNLVGGDLGGGSTALDQQLVFRPVPGWFRYATPVKRLYLCSASAHPGGAVHGMVGSNCARRILGQARRHRA